ncbi:MAG TPA: sulfotransferase [Solirubrobacteraceae bacterium]|nr:sulfotransferase [Solirubrobacteraceae bacterium]
MSSASSAPSSARRTTAARTPDFFIVGSPKTGTTSLYEMLRRHPQIYMPELKEPGFLASEWRPPAGFETKTRELKFPKTLEQYLALFDDAEPQQLAGEASTMYLWSRSAAQNIAELQPDARIVAILREPASFLRSLHLNFLRGRNEDERDLRKAIALETDRREGRRIPASAWRPQTLQYSEHVRYVEQLRRYHARFPRERVLVLIYDDFRSDNAAMVRHVLRFLDVDERRPLAAVELNVTSDTVRSWQLKRLLQQVSTGRGPGAAIAKNAIKAVTTTRLRRGALSTIHERVVLAEPPAPDESFMLELRRRYKPEVVALSEYLDRDLVSQWGYDRIV